MFFRYPNALVKMLLCPHTYLLIPGIQNPVNTANDSFRDSQYITEPLLKNIIGQQTDISENEMDEMVKVNLGDYRYPGN